MKTPEQWAAYVQDQLGDGVSLTEEYRVLVSAFEIAIADVRGELNKMLKMANDRETILRSTLLAFVRVERSFGHNGQHKDSECPDCKRVNMVHEALSHGELNQ